MSDENQAQQIAMLKREMQQRAVLFRRLVERFGPAVLDEVQAVVIEMTAQRLREADLPQRDLDAVLDLLWNQSGEQLDFTVEEHSDTRLVMRVTRCLYADEMRRLGAADVGDAFYCAYDFGFCQGLNPAMQFTRTRTLMAGDDHCDHTYVLEE